ncbi:MAG: DUF4418 family protein [Firmicutes bacterium]|nr:DUF4418 family protein [Bacillota bacterium]
MVNSKVWSLVGGVSIAIGIIIALTPFNLAHVCPGAMELKNGMSTPMKCHWMAVVEVFLGLLIAFNGLLVLFAKNGWQNLSLMLGMLGIAVIIMPTDLGLGVCMNPMMACHTTKAVLTASGAVLIATVLAGWLASRKTSRIPLGASQSSI